MKSRHFAVDEWRCSRPCYFLTHMHADHTQGLSSAWHRGPLYCTSISAALLLSKYKGFDPALINTLDLGAPALISCGLHEDGSLALLEVTAIDAHHCPGAVMYLFRGKFGCILHTGDFRWDVDINGRSYLGEKKQELEALLRGDKIDHLYLDNTFCNPCYDFPTRCEAAQQVIELINRHADCEVVIGVDNLGKEELLLFIAATFKIKIWVWPERLLTMRILGLPDVFTTDTTSTRIRAVPRYSVSVETLAMLNRMHRTIAILPTGYFCSSWPFQKIKKNNTCLKLTTDAKLESCSDKHVCSNCNPFRTYNTKSTSEEINSGQGSKGLCSCIQNHVLKDQDGSSLSSVSTVYVIPYSLHACYAELEDFVQSLKPLSVIGILQSASNLNTNPAYHFHNFLRKDGSCSLESEIKAKDKLPEHEFVHTDSYNVPNSMLITVAPNNTNSSFELVRKSRQETSTHVAKTNKLLFRLRKFYARKRGFIGLRRKGGGTKITTFTENAEKNRLS